MLNSAALACGLAFTGLTCAQTYQVTDLGSFPSGGPSQAFAISQTGMVVGSATLPTGSFHAVQFGPPIKDLGTLPFSRAGDLSEALGVNPAGTVAVGDSYTSVNSSGTTTHAVIYKGGKVTDLGVMAGGFSSRAVAINAPGLVIGNGDAAGNLSRGFTYQMGSGTTLRPLATLGGTWSSAAALNDSGLVVGSATLRPPSTTAAEPVHAAAWTNGVAKDLGTLVPSDPSASSSATAISSNGLITGNASGADGLTHAFLYANGVMTDLGVLVGSTRMTPAGVNSSGVIVGSATLIRSGYRSKSISFIYRDGAMTDLSTLVPPEWSLKRVMAINDAGQIAGTASLGVNGVQHAVLLTP